MTFRDRREKLGISLLGFICLFIALVSALGSISPSSAQETTAASH